MDEVGLVEKVKVIGEKQVRALALCDSGASSTSVDVRLAAKALLGPIVKTIKVRNPSHKTEVRRPVVKARIIIAGREFETNVNVQDRGHMTFPVLIGRNILSGNFVIDTKKNHEVFDKLRVGRRD
jgi:hypothetical protein